MTDQFNEKSFVRIGTIGAPHGLDGRLKVKLHTDIIERFSQGKKLYVQADDGYFDEFTSSGYTTGQDKKVTIQLEEIDSLQKAEEYRGRDIFISRAEAEGTRNSLLGEDSFYYYDLIDCTVIYEGEEYGSVIDIMEAGSGEILVIRTLQGKSVLVPFVESMVDTTGIADKQLIITPVEGLLDS